MTEQTKALPPHLTVIDADTLQVTYEQAKPSMLLADANRKHSLALLLEIDCDEMYTEGTDLLKQIVGAKKDLDEQRKNTGKPLRTALENINSGFNPAIDILEQAEAYTKRVLTKYVDDQAEKERAARAEQERLQRVENDRLRAEAAEAQRKADAEAAQKREEAAAAQRKADAEAAKKREEAAAAQRASNAEAARLNAQAEAARAAGNAAAAAAAEQEAATTKALSDARAAAAEQEAAAHKAISDAAAEAAEKDAASIVQAANENTMAIEQVSLMSTAVVVPLAAPKVSGIGKSTKYTVEIQDPVALLRFIADNYQHFSFYVEFNMSKLNGVAQAQKENFKMAGCVARGETKLSSRRA